MAAPAAGAGGAGSSSSSSSSVAMDLTSSAGSALVPTLSRKRPRHFHQGPDEAEAAAAAAAAGGASSSVGPGAPSSALCRDALGHMFGFLERKDFACATQTQKTWLAAAIGMKSRQDELILFKPVHFDSLLISPLRHHVTSVQLYDKSLPFASVVALAHQLPHVTSLYLPIEVYAGMPPPRWPPSLTDLSLVVRLTDGTFSVDQPAIFVALGQSIAQLRQLHTFTISSSGQLPPAFFRDLASRPALTSLKCMCAMSAECVEDLRRMAHLRQLYSFVFSVEHLRRLVAGDAPIPPLESISQSFSINAESTPLLLRLPTLTELRGHFILPDIGPLLRGLPNLRNLELKCTETVDLDHLVEGLKACPQVTSLCLVHPLLTAASLSTILSSLPCLDTFDFKSHPSLTTLSFLASAGPSLTNLTLRGEQRMDLSEARHLDSMSQLEDLSLLSVFSERFDSYSLASRTPDSPYFHRRTWPHLTYFDYEFAPESSDDEMDEEAEEAEE